jgi:methyl-accepting chemotaxis protein
MQIIEELIEEFQKIRDGYSTEMETIERTMKEVDSFTDAITDLSERTSVLAINASIEAARAGSAGKGFAVIAGEVQKLAGNTKEIAEQINTTVEESVHRVKNSIEQYGTRIQRSVEKLESSGSEHAELVERLTPQVEKISDVVHQSQELSESVTSDLNEVTVHLQYQDTVRQVLEHMIEALEKMTEKGRELAGDPDSVPPEEAKRIREEMMSIVSGFFTTREEREAFGYEIKEDLEDERPEESTREDGELTGDVTLF